MIIFSLFKQGLGIFLISMFCTFSPQLINSSSPLLLKYDANFNSTKFLEQLNNNFFKLMPLFTSASVLCIFSENIEIMAFFAETLNQFNIIIFQHFSQNVLELCDSIIVLDVDTSHNCSDYFTYHFSTPFYFVNTIVKTSIQKVETFLHCFFTTEVVVISLQDDSMYELGPVFPQPRVFAESSVAEVFKHRIWPRKLNLAGITLTVTVMDYIPFFIINDHDKGDYDGIEEQLMREMAKQLNFTPSYLIYRSWGTLMPNGSWADQVGRAMQDKRAEIGIACFWQIPSLYTVMDFGPPMTKILMGFVVKRPQKIDFQWQRVMAIFKPWVWFATLLSFALVVAVYWAGVKWGHHSYSETWAGSALTVLGHLTMTTSHRRVRQGNTRHTLTAWSMFSLLLATSLSTGIVTRLTLPMYTARVDTIRQLAEGHFYWTVEYYRRFRINRQMREFMFDLEDPWVAIFENTYTHLEDKEVLKRAETDEKITFPVQKYGETFVLNTDGLMDNKVLRKFRFSKGITSETLVSIGIKKNSPLYEPLCALNIKFLEVGLVEYWKNAVKSRWPEYDTSHMSVELDIPTFREPEKLTLEKVWPFFNLLLIGLAIASLVFVVEFNW